MNVYSQCLFQSQNNVHARLCLYDARHFANGKRKSEVRHSVTERYSEIDDKLSREDAKTVSVGEVEESKTRFPIGKRHLPKQSH
jgi:hypothetical protein